MYLKALDNDSEVEVELEQLLPMVSNTGNPLSFADGFEYRQSDVMSLSLLDRKIFNWILFSGISPEDCGLKSFESLSVCVFSGSSNNSEMLL